MEKVNILWSTFQHTLGKVIVIELQLCDVCIEESNFVFPLNETFHGNFKMQSLCKNHAQERLEDEKELIDNR